MQLPSVRQGLMNASLAPNSPQSFKGVCQPVDWMSTQMQGGHGGPASRGNGQ